MDWAQILVILLTIAGLFLWLDAKTTSILTAIQAEIKDFHGRLCALEERNRKE